MKNKKGFLAISVIFSFFIVFLMLITLILASYAQNRILMNQVKKDIKNNLNLTIKIPEKPVVLVPVNDSTVKIEDYIYYDPTNTSYNNSTFSTAFSNGDYTRYSVYKGELDPTELKVWKVIKIDDNYIYAISLYCSSAEIKLLGQSTYSAFKENQFSNIMTKVYGNSNPNITFRHYYDDLDKSYLTDSLKSCTTPSGTGASYFSSASTGSGNCSSTDYSMCILYAISNNNTRYQPPTVAKRYSDGSRELNPTITGNNIGGSIASFRPVAIIKKGTNSFSQIEGDSSTLYLK